MSISSDFLYILVGSLGVIVTLASLVPIGLFGLFSMHWVCSMQAYFNYRHNSVLRNSAPIIT